jgi:hypothetical protein
MYCRFVRTLVAVPQPAYPSRTVAKNQRPACTEMQAFTNIKETLDHDNKRDLDSAGVGTAVIHRR